MSIFEFSDYKVFLSHTEATRSSIQRGFRSRLAEFLACQNAYITQILNSDANFSLEQGLKAAKFLKLSEAEAKYFLLLIERARAGTKELQQYFERDLRELKEEHLDIKNRVSTQATLTPDQEATYYSSWTYSVVHMMVTIPEFRTLAKIYSAIALPEDTIQKAIIFLLAAGLVAEKDGVFSPGPTQLHLAGDSPNIIQHHVTWRLAAANSIVNRKSSDIHYSTASSLSFEDAEKLRSYFVEVIQEYVNIVKPSKEETLYNFNLDFYNVLKKS